MAGLPDLLTIEEAAAVIRVGRTKAYALAREWRATDGKAGLPVVDFGHALRVPLCQLEKIVGGPLTARDRTEAMPAEESHPDATPVTGGTPADEAPATGLEAEPGRAPDANIVPDPNDFPTHSSRRPGATTRRRSRSAHPPVHELIPCL